jgi:hypothetical protein
MYNILFLIFLLFAWDGYAQPADDCVYINEKNQIISAQRHAVPERYHHQMRCKSPNKALSASASEMAAPEDVPLKGALREAVLVTSLGRVNLRWPREVEKLFGRTPERAVADAASTVSRALKGGGFDYKMSTLQLDWQIVFMNQEVPLKAVPLQLISNCHPGWMVPPSSVYVVAERVASGCGSSASSNSIAKPKSVNDAELSRLLVHEFGHAVEHQLYQVSGGAYRFDRLRAEGFASWFEQYASQYSSVIPSGSTKSHYLDMAKKSLRSTSWENWHFSGTGEDYARASLIFWVVHKKRGVSGVVDLYKNDRQTKNLYQAATSLLNIPMAQLFKQAEEYAEKL